MTANLVVFVPLELYAVQTFTNIQNFFNINFTEIFFISGYKVDDCFPNCFLQKKLIKKNRYKLKRRTLLNTDLTFHRMSYEYNAITILNIIYGNDLFSYQNWIIVRNWKCACSSVSNFKTFFATLQRKQEKCFIYIYIY